MLQSGAFHLTPLDGAVSPRRCAAGKVEMQHLLHCLSEGGTGSGSAARLSLIPALPGSRAQSSAMATAESLVSGN